MTAPCCSTPTEAETVPECDECPYEGGCGERRCERIEDPSTPEEA